MFAAFTVGHTERQLVDMPLLLFLLLISLTSTALASGAWEPHENIRDAARDHALSHSEQMDGEVRVRIGHLDQRLKLKRCELPLETYESPNGLKPGRSVVGVRCNGSKPWKIYVPVTLGVWQTVVVTAQPISRGQTIQATHLELAEKDIARVHKSYYTDISTVIGQTSKRNLRGGQIVTPNMLGRQQLVKRGSLVDLIVDAGSLRVRMKGKALQNGALGDLVRVRNKNSGKVVSGQVVAAGTVQVGR